jgi:hypothetical protein
MGYISTLRSMLGGSTDQTYEEETKERCDHNWEESRTETDRLMWSESEIQKGYLVVPKVVITEEFCSDCGMDYKEFVSGDYDGGWDFTRQSVPGEKVALSISFSVEEDVSLEEALSEPVEHEPGVGSDRIIVNERTLDLTDA